MNRHLIDPICESSGAAVITPRRQVLLAQAASASLGKLSIIDRTLDSTVISGGHRS
jgi:hypothetical protein